MKIFHQEYGKSNVRLSHIRRAADRHEFTQLNVSLSLSGAFDSAYASGDNALVIPTDTMKNTVYTLAKQHGVPSIETFAQTLARHFLDSFEHVEKAHIAIQQQLWTRIDSDGEKHGHAFIGGGSEENTCSVTAAAADIEMRSGISGLQILKTTESGFVGFLKDQYTTLKETEDRIFATTISANWPCRSLDADWTMVRKEIRAAMLNVFAHRYSPSVQKTLHEMAHAAFDVCTNIDEISIQMPNQHHNLANLTPFELENPNEIFVPTPEPFGQIAATVVRDG